MAVLNQGVLEQVGPSSEVHDRPASAFVAGFVGEANRLDGQVRGGRFAADGVDLAAVGVPDGPASAFVRLHELTLAGPEEAGFEARLERVVFGGFGARLESRDAAGRLVEAGVAREQALALQPGDTLRLAVRGGRVFPAG